VTKTVNSVGGRAHTHCSLPEMQLLPSCPASWKIAQLTCGSTRYASLTSWKRTSSHVDLDHLGNSHPSITILSPSFVELRVNTRTTGCAIHTSSKSHPWDIYGMYISTHGVKCHCELRTYM